MAEDLDVASTRTYRRLVIDLDDLQVAFDLHPSLTVVAASDRQANTLVELFGTAHGVAQPGVHLEYLDEAGRAVLAFRPYGAAHRRIDLHSGALLDEPSDDASDEAACTAASTSPGAGYHEAGDTLRRLAALPQAPLWQAAERLARAEALRESRLAEMASVDDAGEDRVALRWRNRVARRRLRALADALAEVDSAESHWRSLAGETPVRQAQALRPLVQSVAEVRDVTRSVLAVSRPAEDRARRRRRRGHEHAPPVPDLADRAAAAVAEALRRPERPLVLSLVAEAVDAAEAVTILEVLAGLPPVGQVIVVSDQDEVSDWGQLESVTSRASFLDLRPGDEPRRGRSVNETS